MYLKSLTIKGFKSFPKKVELDFEQGITMVVGPNGSGKSNITDAIQWVLGEQSPSALRGSDMQDVIFAGSLNQKALNIAEVTLTLDNSDNTIDLDFNEVSVTRRILRSGENQYFINSTPCRLLDVYELLHDTGLGRQTHSLIGQGRLEEVVNSKPEEKRVLLEEAAGVLKHKKRKERALRKLVSTEENISRATDILDEVNKQLKPLESQVEKAHMYNGLTQELQALEVAHLVKKLTRVKKRWKNIEDEEEDVGKRLGPLQQSLAELTKSIAREEESYQSKASKVAEHQKLKDRLTHINASLEKTLSLQSQKAQTIESNNKDFKEQYDKLQEQHNIKEAQIKNLRIQLRDLEESVSSNLKSISEKRKQSEQLAPSHNEINNSLELNEKKLAENNNQIKTKEAESLAKENDLTFIKKESQSSKQKIVSLVDKIESNKKDAASIKEHIKSNDESLDKANKRFEERQKSGVSLKKELTLIEDEAARNLKEKSKLLGRQSFLNNLSDELEPNNILELSRKSAVSSEPLAKILKVKKKYIRAVESYLGSIVQGLAVNSIGDARKVLEASREAKQKVSIVIKDVRDSGAHSVDNEALSPRTPSWLRVLLKDIIFIKSVDEIPEGDKSGTYVTLAGEVYSNSTLKADYRASKQGLLSLKDELETNRLALDETLKQLKNVDDKKSKFVRQLEENDEQIEQIRHDIQTIKEAGGKFQSELQFVEQNLFQDEQASEDTKKSVAAAEITYAKIREEKAVINAELDELTKEKMAIEKGIDAFREHSQKADKEKQANHLELTELNYQSKNLNHQQVGLKKQLQDVLGEQQLQEKQSKNYLNRFTANEKALMMINKFKPVAELVLESTEYLIESYSAQQLDTDAIQKLKGLREKEKGLSDELKDLEYKKQQFDVDKSGLKSTIDSLADRIINEHNLALETALEKFSDIESDAVRVAEIKDQLKDIGPVNAIAENQFKELKERKDFLESQINDLTNGKVSITKIIRAIDQKIKEKLLVAFEEVSISFKQMFGRLFPGGKAELSLTGENIFEGGLEIKAQPYGKSTKTLSLLSGGETALTALALLFAVYHTRPSPFYVLDEVEAALDDINLQRFIRLLKDMKKKTQFIVITHQRRTMEVADCLYGVTMQADGISKVVSQRIDEAKDEIANAEELSVS